MKCVKCKRPFLKDERIISISGSIMGDEHTDTFYLCPVCQVYTVESCWDNFTGGDETVSAKGLFDKAQGFFCWILFNRRAARADYSDAKNNKIEEIPFHPSPLISQVL